MSLGRTNHVKLLKTLIGWCIHCFEPLAIRLALSGLLEQLLLSSRLPISYSYLAHLPNSETFAVALQCIVIRQRLYYMG